MTLCATLKQMTPSYGENKMMTPQSSSPHPTQLVIIQINHGKSINFLLPNLWKSCASYFPQSRSWNGTAFQNVCKLCSITNGLVTWQGIRVLDHGEPHREVKELVNFSKNQI